LREVQTQPIGMDEVQALRSQLAMQTAAIRIGRRRRSSLKS
jgi:hypothetical protein